MKKVLFLGGNCHVDEMIKISKLRHLFTIMADNIPVDKSLVKGMADEAWDISVTDVDALEEKAKSVGVDAILCGASEICLTSVRELCKRLNLPFYASDKAWDISNDKLRFKEECVNAGICVPKNYVLDMNFSEADLSYIEYPVVVKPADGSGSIGMHICNNQEELIEGYKDAFEKSNIKKVVVEEYILGEQVGLIYLINNGKPILIQSGDDVASAENNQIRVFGFTPTKHTEIYEESFKIKISKLLKNMGCNAGVACLQFIYNGKELIALEMNYRLPGGKNPTEDIMCNAMLDFALGEESVIEFTECLHRAVGYAIWLKPGKIRTIEGIEELKSAIPNPVIQQFRQPGYEVQCNTGMKQIFGFIEFDSSFGYVEKIVDIINNTLRIISDEDKDMMCRFKYDNNGIAIPI